MPALMQAKLLRVLEQKESGADRRRPDHSGGCARDRGHAPKSGRPGAQRRISPGPVSSRLRLSHPAAASARAPRRHPAAGGLFRAKPSPNKTIGSRAKSAPEAYAELERYSWPGNVRELRNVVERLLLLADDRVDRRYRASRLALRLQRARASRRQSGRFPNEWMPTSATSSSPS